jgi:GntR family histidine utilization transcriptional repressor
MTGPGWDAIRAEVLRRIRARDWRPGEAIPTEAALAAEFGCARATVHRALRDLAEAGVVERRRKAGTRVALQPVRRATLEIPVIRAEVEARGQRHGFRLIEDRDLLPPLPVASRLGVGADRPLRRMFTLHLADGRPFLHEDRWLNPAVLPRPAPDFAAVSVNEWLVTHVPFSAGEMSFAAEGANVREARALGVDLGAPLLVTERVTRTETQAVTLVRLAYAPGHRLQMRL